ncbi:MAG: c-type cytochrome, partial [Phycisphaerae bacterium]|nr:c-type cytochrome [Phycisphaerae bacterium]
MHERLERGRTFLASVISITCLWGAPVARGLTPQEPVLPGLHNKHPLSQQQVGDLLLTELSCTACHGGRHDLGFPGKQAPGLAEVGARVSPDYLKRFIAEPSRVQPGTTMPDVLSGETPDRRIAIAEAITHFLVARSSGGFQSRSINSKDIAVGRDLFHKTGCVACHSPRDQKGAEILPGGSVKLAHLPQKYSLSSLSEFLFQPRQVRPSGRMPEMNLTRDEARGIASFLLRPGPSKAVPSLPLETQQRLVALGRTYYQKFNCVACHQLEGVGPRKLAKRWKDVDSSRGCLSPTSNQTPRFNLGKSQVMAIRSALENRGQAAEDKARVDLTMTAFNCIACHERDKYGGVPAARNLLFRTSEKDLGEEARIPPQLTLVGAKLRKVWMQKVLFDGERVRGYMHTRMPQFGENNVKHLPDLFDRLDRVQAVELPEPGRQKKQILRKAGHQLLGDKGLNCVTCHNFNGKASPGFQGLDLMTSYDRLKPSWFYHFMIAPGKYRPRIVMPTYWPDGKAVRPDVLDGDTQAQIEAIWFVLSLGRSAPDPSGIRSVGSKLLVTDVPRTYRGRSRIAGYR